MEESSFLWYTVAWTEVNWNSLYVVILFIKPGACVQEGGDLCRLYDQGCDSCVKQLALDVCFTEHCQ